MGAGIQERTAVEKVMQRLIDGGRVLEANGQGDFTKGHISVRVPGDPLHFFMKPHSVGFDEMTLENIVVCNLDGEKVSGGGRRHSEVYIHSEILKARPDVNSVIHSHPVNAVALSATGKPVLPISQPSVVFYEGVPYYTDTIELIRSQDKGAALARSLGKCRAVLLRNHGVAVVGASIEESTMLALMLDDACRIQLAAQAAGGIGEMFSPEIVERLQKSMLPTEHYFINFDYLLRKLGKQ
jgi:ribulose-5-phosphate 4-epimerase/fuculose-1-phosphate aldolase